MDHRLIRQCWAMVRRSPGPALWLPGLPLLLLAAAVLAMRPVLIILVTFGEGDFPPLTAPALTLLLLGIFWNAQGWAAATWHRLAFAASPARRPPPVTFSLAWSYSWRLLLLHLALGWTGLVVTFAMTHLWSPSSLPVSLLLRFGIGTALAWAALRLLVVLPALAAGRPLALTEVWKATAPAALAVIGPAALLSGLGLAVWTIPWFALLVGLGPWWLIPPALLTLLAYWVAVLLLWSVPSVLHGGLSARDRPTL